MKLATLLRPALAVATLAVLAAGPVRAQVTSEPISGFAGHVRVAPDGFSLKSGNSIDALTPVYDNTLAPAIFGVSSTDLASVWGDRLLTTSTGILDSHVFGVFNSASSAGSLLTANIAVDFYDGVSSAYLGGYTTSVNFGAGLGLGLYTQVSVAGLAPLAINLPMDVIVLQRVTAKTGAATRLGIASLDPVTVGSSPASMYISSATIGGGVAGFYNLANGPANPAHKLVMDLVPVGATATTWGKLKRLYH